MQEGQPGRSESHWSVRNSERGSLSADPSSSPLTLPLPQRPVSFIDTMKNERQDNRYCKPVHTVRASRPFSPYPLPFNYP